MNHAVLHPPLAPAGVGKRGDGVGDAGVTVCHGNRCRGDGAVNLVSVVASVVPEAVCLDVAQDYVQVPVRGGGEAERRLTASQLRSVLEELVVPEPVVLVEAQLVVIAACGGVVHRRLRRHDVEQAALLGDVCVASYAEVQRLREREAHRHAVLTHQLEAADAPGAHRDLGHHRAARVVYRYAVHLRANLFHTKNANTKQ